MFVLYHIVIMSNKLKIVQSSYMIKVILNINDEKPYRAYNVNNSDKRCSDQRGSAVLNKAQLCS